MAPGLLYYLKLESVEVIRLLKQQNLPHTGSQLEIAIQLGSWDMKLERQLLEQGILFDWKNNDETLARIRAYDLNIEFERVEHDPTVQKLPLLDTQEETTSGSKADGHKQNSYFPFQELPLDIRYQIYELAAEYVCEPSDSGAQIAREGRFIPAEYENDDLMALQPGLFRASKWTRAEGLPVFYNHRRFIFHTTNNFVSARSICLNNLSSWPRVLISYVPFLQWLVRIGQPARDDIRHLIFVGHFDQIDWQSMQSIHQKLSDKATVVYRPKCRDSIEHLWAVGVSCNSSKENERPIFRFYDRVSMTINDIPCIDDKEWRSNGLGLSLVFYPGWFWFGEGQQSIEILTAPKESEWLWRTQSYLIDDAVWGGLGCQDE